MFACVFHVFMFLRVEKAVQLQKHDVIAELKLSKDLDGIKKQKHHDKNKDEVSRAQFTQLHRSALTRRYLFAQAKEKIAEINQQFKPENFLNQVPEVDPSGATVPQW